ncbi:hypothetical protein HID58_067671, partial [Brassica napus]
VSTSKKVKDYDKLEDEVKKNRRMISLKETLLSTSSSSFFSHGDYNVFGILIDSFVVLHNQQVESNGTMLSIDWKDVGATKIECTLHDDLALKTREI